MTRTELAEALGVSLAQVSRIASGERRPSLDLMEEIRRVVGWPVPAQLKALREGTYPSTFIDRMERRQARRRDVDSQAVRSMSEADPGGAGVPALETDSQVGEESRMGEGPSPKLDISDRWYPR